MVKFYSKNAGNLLFLEVPGKNKTIKVQFKPFGNKTGQRGFGFLVTENEDIIAAIKASKKYGVNGIHEDPNWLLKKGTTEALAEYGKNKAMATEEVKAKIEEKAELLAAERAVIAVEKAKQEMEAEKAARAEANKKYIAEYSMLAAKRNSRGEWNPGTPKADMERFAELETLIIGAEK